MTPDPNQPYVGRNAFAHKGGMHVAGVRADSRTFEHVSPEVVGNRRELLVSELSGKGTVLARAEEAGIELTPERALHAVERLKELEHRGYHFEAADASFDLLLRKESGDYEPLFRLESFRVITEKREDGKVQTEATIKVWARGERLVRTAEGNGPVNALDRALRDAIADLYPRLRDIELVNYKVRIIDEHKGTGAVTRVLIDASDSDETWGTIGVSENIIEASWEALVDSLEYALQGRSRASDGRPLDGTRLAASVTGEPIPLARPDVGPREEELVRDVLRSGRLSLGPMLERFERDFAAWVGSEEAVAVSSGTAALHLAVRALGWSAGDEVVTTPLSFVASANCLLYEQAVPVFCDIDERTLNIDPEAAAAACGPRTAGTAAGAPVRVPGRHGGARGARPAAGTGRGRGRVRGARLRRRRGHEGRRERQPGGVRLLREQAARDRRGRDADLRRRARSQPRVRSERNQGRADDMDWLSHDRLGFNYRLSDVAAALGVAQVERLDALLAERDRVARLYRERLAGIEGLVLPCEDRGNERRSWFVFVVQVPDECRPRRRDRRARRARASPPRPTCRASTSSRCTASGSASGAGSSRSPSGWRRARSRCRSSRRWGRPRWSGSHRRWRLRSASSVDTASGAA